MTETAEDVLLQWLLENSTVSNVELAHLSNVSRRWRYATKRAILEQAIKFECTSRLLLLPSMVRFIARTNDSDEHKSDIGGASCSLETFCAAWFHPECIQEQLISLHSKSAAEEEEEIAQNYHSQKTSAFAPSGEQTYEGSDDDKEEVRSRSSRKQQRRQQRSKSPPSLETKRSLEDLVAVCEEWRGYRTAMDVLHHFCYAASFVKDVIDAVKVDDTVISAEAHELTEKGPNIRKTTFAARGAVVARPESYCYCVDSDVEQLKAWRASTAGDEYGDIRVQEYKQSLIRKERRRRELQRDVLPRIITRATYNAEGLQLKRQPQLRCVQFLNATGGHAVCMLTPPFACGPLPEPVTVFCVGIATEDGCFLSGLHRRFELGHLYPNDEVAVATEQSPVCISTDCGYVEGFAVQNKGSDSSNCDHPSIHKYSDSADDDSSFDCFHDEASPTQKCACIFNGVGEKLSTLDEDKPRRIHRGRLGPGAWHCYVAVFDGENSLIRIDGVSEPVKADTPDSLEKKVKVSGRNTSATLDGLTIGSDHCFGMSLCCGNGSGGEGEGAIAELAVFRGRLDLTDIQILERQMMVRNGIPAEPKEAFATMGEVDGSDSSSLLLWRENDWARKAQALFFLNDLTVSTASTKDDGDAPLPQVPLRFLARHRSVAWKQSNPVTGEPIHIKRIGCKAGASSSDF